MSGVAADARLISAVRLGLEELADREKAAGMQAYMRSDMPYRGASTPQWRPLARRLSREHPAADVATLVATVRELWHNASFREERYVAIELTGDRRYAGWQTPQLLPLYEELIVTGAWWDLVDVVATKRVGPLLRSYPAELSPVLRTWATDENLWKRRTSIICQIGAKADTDTDLLTFAIESNVDDREFFLLKGIGWALREYSKSNAAWVADFVHNHPGLSGLSRREASKYLRSAAGQRSAAP
jgi:3-methyladenine DNA glycosylase AlkD